MPDIFDIVKLYQEDITKVDYQRKVIDASRNARQHKLNISEITTITRPRFTVVLTSNIDRYNSNKKGSFFIWYKEDGNKFTLHMGNVNSGSEIRNIIINAPLHDADEDSDGTRNSYIIIDDALLHFDNLINDANFGYVGQEHGALNTIIQVIFRTLEEHIQLKVDERRKKKLQLRD